jgi:hypothetical protein
MENIQFHEIVNDYPLMNQDDLAALADDIVKHGLRDPNIILLDGKILDGRNRYLACQICGKLDDLVFLPFDTFEHGASPQAFVLSKNKYRRHIQAVVATSASTEMSQMAPHMADQLVLRLSEEQAAVIKAVFTQLMETEDNRTVSSNVVSEAPDVEQVEPVVVSESQAKPVGKRGRKLKEKSSIGVLEHQESSDVSQDVSLIESQSTQQDDSVEIDDIHVPKMSSYVRAELKKVKEDKQVASFSSDSESESSISMNVSESISITAPQVSSEEISVSRLILMMLNSGWLKTENGTPGTLADEIERQFNVVVEISEVLKVMAEYGFEVEEESVAPNEHVLLEKTAVKPETVQLDDLKAVDWGESDPEMNAVLNKEMDDVPVVLLTHVKQIEHDVNVESTMKASAAVCRGLQTTGTCKYAPGAFGKCNLRLFWKEIKHHHPSVSIAFDMDSLVFSVS